MPETVMIRNHEELHDIERESRRRAWWKRHRLLRFFLIVLCIAAVFYVGAVIASYFINGVFDFTPSLKLTEVFN